MGVVMKAKCLLLLCAIMSYPIALAGPAHADTFFSDWRPLSCQGHLEPESGPSWDLGPECNAVADPAFGIAEATVDYADAQAYAVCTFVDDGPATVDCSLFAPDGG